MKAYAGIGSRETPEDILSIMRDLGERLAGEGWVLRSGAAPRADSAFEEGCDRVSGPKEIFLPWSGFQNRRPGGGALLIAPERLAAAQAIASVAHPRWQYLSRGAKALHTRNVGQILGPNLDVPVRFVLCWTPKGAGGGGTGQAIRIAQARGIEVLDLGNPLVLDRVLCWLKGLPGSELSPIPE